jgi:hypothetical protein
MPKEQRPSQRMAWVHPDALLELKRSPIGKTGKTGRILRCPHCQTIVGMGDVRLEH